MTELAPVFKSLKALGAHASKSTMLSRFPVLVDGDVLHTTRKCAFLWERHPAEERVSLERVLTWACSGCFSVYSSFAGESYAHLDTLAASLAHVELGLKPQLARFEPLEALASLELRGFNWENRHGTNPLDPWYEDLLDRLRALEARALEAVREPELLSQLLTRLGQPGEHRSGLFLVRGPRPHGYPSMLFPLIPELDALVRAHHHSDHSWLVPAGLLDVLRARGGDFVRDASEVTDLTAAELETLDVLVREDGASTLERLVEVARSL